MEICALSELFEVKYGVNLELNALEKSHKGINFVARTAKNNGVSAHVKRLPYVKPIPAGTISVACGGSVLESFLQSEPYYSGRDLFYLTAKTEMSDELKLFYCHCLRMNKFKYSYGRQANITLPSLQVPCLEEAEKFVKGLSIQNTKKLMVQRLNIKELKESTIQNNKVELIPLSSLFHMKNGIASTGLERISYKKNANWIPYIRPSYRQSTSIDAYVNRNMFMDGEVYPKNTLYVSTNGQGSHTFSYVSVGDFVPNSDVTVLLPKREMTLKEKLFYAMCITHNRFKFSYGRKPKGQKLAEILLPSTITEEFDNINIDNIITEIK